MSFVDPRDGCVGKVEAIDCAGVLVRSVLDELLTSCPAVRATRPFEPL